MWKRQTMTAKKIEENKYNGALADMMLEVRGNSESEKENMSFNIFLEGTGEVHFFYYTRSKGKKRQKQLGSGFLSITSLPSPSPTRVAHSSSVEESPLDQSHVRTKNKNLSINKNIHAPLFHVASLTSVCRMLPRTVYTQTLFFRCYFLWLRKFLQFPPPGAGRRPHRPRDWPWCALSWISVRRMLPHTIYS